MSCDLRCSCKNSKKKFKFDPETNGRKLKSTKKEKAPKNKKDVKCAEIVPTEGDCTKPAGWNKIVADFCPKKCDDCYEGITV